MNDVLSFNITLTDPEMGALLQALGSMPTQMGVYPIYMRIQEQVREQLPQEPEA